MLNDLTTTRELFAYTAWADASVWTAVLHEAAASADGRVRDYLFHIHTVQGLFLAVWRGAPLQAPPKKAPGLTFLLASARSTHAGCFRHQLLVGSRKVIRLLQYVTAEFGVTNSGWLQIGNKCFCQIEIRTSYQR